MKRWRITLNVESDDEVDPFVMAEHVFDLVCSDPEDVAPEVKVVLDFDVKAIE